MKLFSYLLGNGFAGGPDFNLNQSIYFDLNGIELEITIPDSNILLTPSKPVESIPFNKSHWFENNCSQLSNHFYVHVTGGQWAYTGPFWKVMNEPFGTLAVRVWIKKVLPTLNVKLKGHDSLQAAIAQEYERFFEVDEPGEFGRGKNKQKRREAEERFSQEHWNNEEGIRRKKVFLEKYCRELPKEFESREYGTQHWLYYALEREPTYPVHHYCQALNEHFYLDINFQYGVDFKKYFHLWKAHAENAEQQIIEKVRLSFPDRLSNSDSIC